MPYIIRRRESSRSVVETVLRQKNEGSKPFGSFREKYVEFLNTLVILLLLAVVSSNIILFLSKSSQHEPLDASAFTINTNLHIINNDANDH